MKIALFGYGRMGREIERLAVEARHEIALRYDPSGGSNDCRQSITSDDLSEVDVCIDFTHADAVLSNIALACDAKKPIVIGTTAWTDEIPEATRLIEAAGTGMIHAPNFAIGVQTMFRVVAECAAILNSATDFDVSVFEAHHRLKADSPSGTAKALANIVLDNVDAKTSIVNDAPQRALNNSELHVVSQRLGAIPGSHAVTFDLGEEVLEINHTSRGRGVFATGAVAAAEWIVGKTGVYEFSGMLFGDGGQ